MRSESFFILNFSLNPLFLLLQRVHWERPWQLLLCSYFLPFPVLARPGPPSEVYQGVILAPPEQKSRKCLQITIVQFWEFWVVFSLFKLKSERTRKFAFFSIYIDLSENLTWNFLGKHQSMKIDCSEGPFLPVLLKETTFLTQIPHFHGLSWNSTFWEFLLQSQSGSLVINPSGPSSYYSSTISRRTLSEIFAKLCAARVFLFLILV